MSCPLYVLVARALAFACILLAASLPGGSRALASTRAGCIALVGVGIVAAYYPLVEGGNVVRFELPWLPMLGLNLTLRLAGFTWLFAELVLGIGALVILYARYYMSPEDPVQRFFAFLQAFMGAMPGIVLSGNQIGRASCRKSVCTSV